jgi:hypothetical protein
MQRIGRALGKYLTYANIVATLALLFAMGGTAAAAVLITSNSQVAQNTISGHGAPTGKHANLISGSVNATDLASGVKASFKVHCPVGLQLGGDLCFDGSPRAVADWQTALSDCFSGGLRLASIGELGQVLDHTGAPQNAEWTAEVFRDSGNYEAADLTEDTSRTIFLGSASILSQLPYRCVASPTN